MNKIKFKTEIIEKTDHYIFITINKNIPIKYYAYNIVRLIMQFMNAQIGANTIINYHILPVSNFTIKIPIYKYLRNDSKEDISSIINLKISEIDKFFESFDWTKHNKIFLWMFRSLTTMKINVSELFLISCEYIDYNEPLHFSIPKIEYPQTIDTVFDDGSVIHQYVDPYIINYGLFCNLSKSFDEMNYSYNILHLYEHVMTYAWKNLDSSQLVDLNGATFPHAICNIYAVTRTKETIVDYAINYIKFYVKGRNKNFWNSVMDEGVKIETIRTISESYSEKSLTVNGRSDPSAYDSKYNRDIFAYWCQTPFDILIVTPELININKANINKFISKNKFEKIPRPTIEIFDRYPLDVVNHNKIVKMIIVKKDPKKIAKNILENKKTRKLYGIDCSITIGTDDLSSYCTSVYPLLYSRKYINKEELDKYIKTVILPPRSEMFGTMSLISPNLRNYFKNLIPEEELQ